MELSGEKLRISEWPFGVRHFGKRYLLVSCDNIILSKQWNVQKFINPKYYCEINRFNSEKLHKTYVLYKSE